MTATNLETRRNLVSHTLTEQQQVSILGGLAADPSVDEGRVETLSRIIFALQGSYNETGIQRWFERPNAHAQNRRPIDILSGDWKAEERRVQALLIVSQRLCGDPALAGTCQHCNPSPKPAP